MLRLRNEANSVVLDPRAEQLQQQLRELDNEIDKYEDELKIHKKQRRLQTLTLSKENEATFSLVSYRFMNRVLQTITKSVSKM